MSQTTKAPPEPCILGVVAADALAARRYPAALWACGGIELRADGLRLDDIAGAVADFDAEKSRRGFIGPVIFTLRLRRDGGAWPDEKSAERNSVWESLPPGTCDWVDLEVEEIASVSPTALDSLRSSGVKILLSHHAFEQEPREKWEQLLDEMAKWAPDGVKFAMALGPNSGDRIRALALLAFARRVASLYSDSAVFGMGEEGRLTRVVSPLLGCPWTYGFLGGVPQAPGQLSADRMREFFARAPESFPGTDASDAAILGWATALWARVTDA